jgi:hypothetical protein
VSPLPLHCVGEDVLTVGSLRNKLSKTGEHFENAMAHLHTLGLPGLIADTKVGRLGRNNRDLMIRPFTEALARQKRQEIVRKAAQKVRAGRAIKAPVGGREVVRATVVDST